MKIYLLLPYTYLWTMRRFYKRHLLRLVLDYWWNICSPLRTGGDELSYKPRHRGPHGHQKQRNNWTDWLAAEKKIIDNSRTISYPRNWSTQNLYTIFEDKKALDYLYVEHCIEVMYNDMSVFHLASQVLKSIYANYIVRWTRRR